MAITQKRELRSGPSFHRWIGHCVYYKRTSIVSLLLADVYESSPDVYESSPDVYESSPDVYESSPDVYESSPDYADKEGDVAAQQVPLTGDVEMCYCS